MARHAHIPERAVATISIPARSRLLRQPKALEKVRIQLKKEIRTLRRSISTRRKVPIPKAAAPYRAMMSQQGRKKDVVRPGRLRKASQIGMKVEGIKYLGKGSPIKIKWGVKAPPWPTRYINYSGYVAQMSGGATGGGPRFNWPHKFRKWLVVQLRLVVKRVNTRHKLKSTDALVLFKK